MHNLLIVCYGNTCRSPMFEMIFKALIQKYDLSKQVAIESAGVLEGDDGRPMNPNAKKALGNLGYVVDEHRSRCLWDLEKEFDMYYSISPEVHLQLIKRKTFWGKVSILNHPHGISDPWEKPYEAYLSCAKQIEESAKNLIRQYR